MTKAVQSQMSPADAETIRTLKARADWAAIAKLAPQLEEPLTVPQLPLADEVAFALGRLGRYRDAALLRTQILAIEPTWRRLSAMAYIYYESALVRRSPGRKSDQVFELNESREGFRSYVQQALTEWPESLKDLYRLGMFEAQVESAHDKVALRAFLRVIELYRALPKERRRGDLHKVYVKALYAGGRSALRLRMPKLARRLAFACHRQDRKDAIDPVHRLDLAGRACFAFGELDHAERAFRSALQAKGPPRRAHIHARIARVLAAKGDLPGAIAWLERKTRPERRAAYIWRLLGDLMRQAGDVDGALASYHAAIQQDRMGKHLTWTEMAALHETRGELKRAERTYRKAVDFARRQWQKEHVPAIEGLARVLEARGKPQLAAQLRAPLAKAHGALKAPNAKQSG